MFRKITLNYRKYANGRFIALGFFLILLGLYSPVDIELGYFPIAVKEDYPTVMIAAIPKKEKAVTQKAPKKTGMSVPKGLQGAPSNVRRFVKRWLPISADMFKRYDIPISSQLAQGGCESDWGTSSLCDLSNNYFGIKCWNRKGNHNHGICIKYADDKPNDYFFGYETSWESWKHHALFLLGDRYKKCLKEKSVASYNLCIDKAGYATGADYGGKLNRIISQYGLDAFDGLTVEEATKVAKMIK